MNQKEFILKHANQELVKDFILKVNKLTDLIDEGSYRPTCEYCNRWIKSKMNCIKFLQDLRTDLQYSDVNDVESEQ